MIDFPGSPSNGQVATLGDNKYIWNSSTSQWKSYNTIDTFVAPVTFSNTVGIGASNPGSYQLYVTGSLYVSTTITEGSSIKVKENIRPITNGLDTVLQLNGYVYDRKDRSTVDEPGLIAEEVEQVLPNVVSHNEDGSVEGVQYTKVIAYLIESIKELKTELDETKKQLQALETTSTL